MNDNEITSVDPARAGPATMFRALAEIIYTRSSYDEIYAAICGAATVLVDGCDHASLMLRQNGRFITVAASDDIAMVIDEAEREFNEGPCLDAVMEQTAQLDTDLATHTEWPALAEYVLAETPVRGAAGFRLILDDRKVGALNLFSNTAGALTERSADQAAVLAAFTSVAQMALSSQESAESLRDALTSNREIGKAVGLMMAFHKVSDEEAFNILKKASQDMNIKLTKVAREVIDHHNRR